MKYYILKEEVLFPANPCRPGGSVEFQPNGDMKLLGAGVTLTYREFCVEQNLPVSTRTILKCKINMFTNKTFRVPQT